MAAPEGKPLRRKRKMCDISIEGRTNTSHGIQIEYHDWKNSETQKVHSTIDMERDRESEKALEELEYTVLRFWGKEIISNTESCADTVEYFVK